MLPGGGFIAFDATSLGFALNPAGATILFQMPVSGNVLDAVQYEGQARDVSIGRFPKWSNRFLSI